MRRMRMRRRRSSSSDLNKEKFHVHARCPKRMSEESGDVRVSGEGAV